MISDILTYQFLVVSTFGQTASEPKAAYAGLLVKCPANIHLLSLVWK